MRDLETDHVISGPMRGLEKNRMGWGHTNTQTCGHRDSMIELAQWADSMKRVADGHGRSFGSWPWQKQGGVPDWMRGLSPHSVPDCPRMEPYKRGGVLNWTVMFC